MIEIMTDRKYEFLWKYHMDSWDEYDGGKVLDYVKRMYPDILNSIDDPILKIISKDELIRKYFVKPNENMTESIKEFIKSNVMLYISQRGIYPLINNLFSNEIYVELMFKGKFEKAFRLFHSKNDRYEVLWYLKDYTVRLIGVVFMGACEILKISLK